MLMWVPEDVNKGLYAHKNQAMQKTTYNLFFALRFATEEDCLRWCTLNPWPPFTPQRHEFKDK